MTILEVIIGEKHYALDTDEVLEYAPYAQPDTTPEQSSAYIEGTTMHTGLTYTVVDMRRYMRLDPIANGFFVYLKQKDPAAALHVDNVTGVYMEAPEGLELLSATTIVSSALSGLSELDKADKAAKEAEKKARAEAEKAAAEKKKRDKQTTIFVENKELEAALDKYNQDHTVESLNVLVNTILHCRLLLPAGFNAQQRPVPMLLRNQKGESFLPIYTCRERVTIKPEPRAILNLSYESLNRMGLDKDIKASGIVINAAHENVLFKRELLEEIDAAYTKHEEALKQREEQLKKYGNGPIPVDPSAAPDATVDNTALETAMDAQTSQPSPENLKKITELLKNSHLYVPGMLDDKKQPRLSLLKNKDGMQFIPAFTSKGKVTTQPKPQAVFCVPFSDLNRNALNQKDVISGILLNLGSHGVVLTTQLLQMIADETAE